MSVSKFIAAALVAAILSVCTFGQRALSADAVLDSIEVRFANAAAPAPTASIGQLAWMAGQWRSKATPDGFAGGGEHVILEARDGQMPGFVRVMNREGGTMLFELSSFLAVDGVLTYRNRHFAPDLIAWQAPEEFVDRPLVAIEDDAVYFDGITFVNQGPSRMGVAFILTDEEGVQKKYYVAYRKVPAGDESDDRSDVLSILAELDNPSLTPDQQLMNYREDAVILAPDQREIRGHGAIRRHLSEIKEAAVVHTTHQIVELSSFKEVVIAQGGVVGEARPVGASNPFFFETKNIILFKRADGDRLKIWKVIYNSAPGAIAGSAR